MSNVASKYQIDTPENREFLRDSDPDRRDRRRYLEILMACKRAGNPDLVYKFSSTSKITFPGSGIAALATSPNNLEDIVEQLKNQTIGHDKVNQLRHVRYFGDIHGMMVHMKKHADILRPKFEMVEWIFDEELGDLGIGEWTKPIGGYFIYFKALDGRRRRSHSSRQCGSG